MSARGWAVPALLLLGAMMLALSPQGMAVGRGGETDASARVVVLEPEGTGDGAGARFAGVKGEVDAAVLRRTRASPGDRSPVPGHIASSSTRRRPGRGRHSMPPRSRACSCRRPRRRRR